ncbi:MAG: M23 family metallopeptidase [Acidobacteria bacterium]|nr:M23 family metallopeptidase [Acidobacteriota bacterium]
MRALFFLALAVVLIVAVVWLAGARTEITLARPLKVVGKATPVEVRVSGKNGVRYFRARLEQGGRSFVAFEQTDGGPRWKVWRRRAPVRAYRFVAGPQLQVGPARLLLEAQSDDWRGSITVASLDLMVRTEPPPLSVDTAQHYINQGGSEMVVFTTSVDAAESGVRVGPYRFRSFPLPDGAPGSRFCIFAFPYDVPATTAPLVYARDDAGNERTATFWFRVFPKKFRTRDFELTEDFLKKVTEGIRPHTPQIRFTGDLLADYLKINRDLRRGNNRSLADLRSQTDERFLWSAPFRQLADSKVEAQFADRRRYRYQGAQVDEQDHLGFDLAVTANVAVVAANDGKVVFADFLGIYGNCIVIDHGYALQSMYGHLSSVDVKVGDRVRQGQQIGLSGSTGLAGGDHLHFGMQVDGVQVNPAEWWDPHWIHDRLLLKFPGEKLPAAAAARGGRASGDSGASALAHRRSGRGRYHARSTSRGLAHRAIPVAVTVASARPHVPARPH